MTVRELIAALSKCDQEREVVFMDDWWIVPVARVDPDYERYSTPTDKVLLVMLEPGERL
jgi:hypothetical protein